MDEVCLFHMGSRWWKYKVACESQNLKLGFRKLLLAKSLETTDYHYSGFILRVITMLSWRHFHCHSSVQCVRLRKKPELNSAACQNIYGFIFVSKSFDSASWRHFTDMHVSFLFSLNFSLLVLQ